VSTYTQWYLDNAGTLSSKAPRRDGRDSLTWAAPDEPEALVGYTTPVLTKGATLAGPISATAYVKSSNTNLELISRLYDLAPDGTKTQIVHGTVLGSQRGLDPRKSWVDTNGVSIRPWTLQDRDSYLVPGQIYRVDISMFATQWGVRPGHRLRLELTTQAGDQCSGAGAGLEPCYLTAPQAQTLPGGTYAVLHGPSWHSAVNLPILPYRTYETAASGGTPTSNGAIEPLDWGSRREHP
jgi:hypothetical protein